MEPIYIPNNNQDKSKCKICKKHNSSDSKLVDGICKDCLALNKNVSSKIIEENEKVIIKQYKGLESDALDLFKKDSLKMAEKGYFPINQNWIPGSYGCGSFIVALLLCIIIIGILVFIYMLIVKPQGTLIVTYELKSIKEEISNELMDEEKECPQCAEFVKSKAKICRFCRYEFE